MEDLGTRKQAAAACHRTQREPYSPPLFVYPPRSPLTTSNLRFPDTRRESIYIPFATKISHLLYYSHRFKFSHNELQHYSFILMNDEYSSRSTAVLQLEYSSTPVRVLEYFHESTEKRWRDIPNIKGGKLQKIRKAALPHRFPILQSLRIARRRLLSTAETAQDFLLFQVLKFIYEVTHCCATHLILSISNLFHQTH